MLRFAITALFVLASASTALAENVTYVLETPGVV